MTTLTITITEPADGPIETVIDKGIGSTPQEILGLIAHGMLDATAIVILASEIGPQLRSVEPQDGESVDEAARKLARGMAVNALTQVLPKMLLEEERTR